MRPHPALKLARPAILIGGLLAVIGALFVTGRVDMAGGMVIGIITLCLGIGGVIFGVFTQAAWRVVLAAQNQAETEERE